MKFGRSLLKIENSSFVSAISDYKLLPIKVKRVK